MARRGGSTAADRWYSPRLGQFVSHDPAHVDSTNLYAFAGLTRSTVGDPMGLAASDLACDPSIASCSQDFSEDPANPQTPSPKPDRFDFNNRDFLERKAAYERMRVEERAAAK
ncbi:MAG: hypothetical protein R3E66_22655 [bacterium]